MTKPTAPDREPGWVFDLSGGRLCLDLANTVGGMRGVSPHDHLRSYEDLIAFAVQARAIPDARGRRLLAEARRRPRDAEAVFARAVALREALYRLFSARARGEAPGRADVDAASEEITRALACRRLVREGEGFALAWDERPDALDAPLWPIAESAARLLTSPDELARVRVCGMYDEGECSWLFVDQTRARTRRWCSMQDCGNRAKARRHHARARQDG
jgi:predicted RNA-binding Zn ribbon-like protein